MAQRQRNLRGIPQQQRRKRHQPRILPLAALPESKFATGIHGEQGVKQTARLRIFAPDALQTGSGASNPQLSRKPRRSHIEIFASAMCGNSLQRRITQ